MRKRMWDCLREESIFDIPELDYPTGIRSISLAVAAGAVAVEQLQLWQIGWLQIVWPVLAIIGLWMFIETYFKLLSLLSRFRTRLPRGIVTVKDLCRRVLRDHAAEFGNYHGLKARPSPVIWDCVRRILASTFGGSESEINFESRLIADLGME